MRVILFTFSDFRNIIKNNYKKILKPRLGQFHHYFISPFEREKIFCKCIILQEGRKEWNWEWIGNEFR